MELILAHHEIWFVLIRYGLALIGAYWFFFKWLFPMIGRWCCNLRKKLKDKKDPHFQTWAELKKQREDDKCVIDGLYMDEDEIESCYKGDQR